MEITFVDFIGQLIANPALGIITVLTSQYYYKV